MTDPLTLASLTAVSLSEAIKFLYGQAAELLRRRRERKEESPPVVPAGLLDGTASFATVDERLLAAKLAAIQELYGQLTVHAQGIADVDPADAALVGKAETLRSLLELVYGERITFVGERRDASGTRVDVTAQAQRVEGYLAALRVGTVGAGADVRAATHVGDVGPGGQAVGIDADRIGGR
jgi:hypothetical protein